MMITHYIYLLWKKIPENRRKNKYPRRVAMLLKGKSIIFFLHTTEGVRVFPSPNQKPVFLGHLNKTRELKCIT